MSPFFVTKNILKTIKPFHAYCWKMISHTLKILQREHCKICKVWPFFKNTLERDSASIQSNEQSGYNFKGSSEFTDLNY